MGGIVASIIATEVIRPARLIRISSGVGTQQLLPMLRTIGPLGKVMPFEIALMLPARVMPASLRLAFAMLQTQDMSFIRWACNAILAWPGIRGMDNAVVIHGTADMVFPIGRQPRVDVQVPGGGHLMIITHAVEVSAAMRPFLQSTLMS
jgi:pimeloyl-ACP methyl ester carboxylesterase